MDDLANETLIKIFNYLTYDDLIILKNVNIRFNDLVNHVVSNNIVWVADFLMGGPVIFKAFPFDSELNESMFIHINQCLISKSQMSFKYAVDMHSTIKKLIIHDANLLSSMIVYESLIQLEIVAIQSFPSLKKKSHFTLRAPNLHSFLFKSERIESILLDCAKLRIYITNLDLNEHLFLHPESLTNLNCVSLTKSIGNFKNLRKLHCDIFDQNNHNILKALKHLEEFSFITTQFHREASHILNMSTNTDLSIYYRGISIDTHPLQDNDVVKLPVNNYFGEEHLKAYSKYLHVIHPTGLYESELDIKEIDTISYDLINKLNKIKIIHLYKEPKDISKLIRLLKLPEINKVVIHDLLSQGVLNSIPQCCPNIFQLVISDFNELDFVLNLANLRYLNCGKLFDFALFHKIVGLNYLEEVKFEINNEIELNCRLFGDNVECCSNKKPVLLQSKSLFRCTIDLLQNWVDLFNLD